MSARMTRSSPWRDEGVAAMTQLTHAKVATSTATRAGARR